MNARTVAGARLAHLLLTLRCWETVSRALEQCSLYLDLAVALGEGWAEVWSWQETWRNGWVLLVAGTKEGLWGWRWRLGLNSWERGTAGRGWGAGAWGLLVFWFEQ